MARTLWFEVLQKNAAGVLPTEGYPEIPGPQPGEPGYQSGSVGETGWSQQDMDQINRIIGKQGPVEPAKPIPFVDQETVAEYEHDDRNMDPELQEPNFAPETPYTDLGTPKRELPSIDPRGAHRKRDLAREGDDERQVANIFTRFSDFVKANPQYMIPVVAMALMGGMTGKGGVKRTALGGLLGLVPAFMWAYYKDPNVKNYVAGLFNRSGKTAPVA